MTIEDLIQQFKFQMTNVDAISKSTIKSYCTGVRNIDKLGKINIVKELQLIVKNGGNGKAQLESLMNRVDTILYNSNLTSKQINDFSSAFRKFAQCILGTYFANLWMGVSANDAALCQLVASNALFATNKVVNNVKKGILGAKNNIGVGNPWASWDNMCHVRKTGVKKGTILPNGLIADDNTLANHAIKKAVLLSQGITFSTSFDSMHYYEACHVWDMPGDPCCYASIANLILLPRALGQLTDHNESVKNLLRYEVYKRFGFLPSNQQKPIAPSFYKNIKWRN